MLKTELLTGQGEVWFGVVSDHAHFTLQFFSLCPGSPTAYEVTIPALRETATKALETVGRAKLVRGGSETLDL